MPDYAPFDRAEFETRHRRVRERMEAEGVDAILAYSNSKVRGAVRYLSNYFTRLTGAQSQPDGSYLQFGSCACLFPLDGEPVLVMDQPWDVERCMEVSIVERTSYAPNFGTELGRVIAERGYRRVGIDNWFIFPALHYLPLVEAAPNAEFVPTQLIELVYQVKSPAEIALIRKAEEAAIKAIEAGFAAVGVGVPEYEFALAAEIAMRRYGELELAGNSIVSGGPNSATGSSAPTQSSSYVMQRGDWALFDITPSYAGYAGDISRMIVAGDVDDLDPELKRMYDVTLQMNLEVLKAIRPGVIPRSLNQLAEDVAREGGFGDNKIGLVGHSLGLDIHDPPDYYFDDSPLAENMVITVEPCLLLPGRGGTRIEDVVVVTADGCEVLTAACPKELTGTG